MKFKKLTAAAMSVLILLTGCGQAAVSDSGSPSLPDISTTVETSGEAETSTEEATETSVTSATVLTSVTSSRTTTSTSAAVSTAYAASITTTAAVQHTDAEPVYTPPAQEYVPVQEPVNTDPEPYVPPAPAVTTQAAVTTAPPKTTTAAPVPADLTPKQLMNKMTLEQKVCQMFMVTPEALTGISPMVEVGQGTANAMKKYPVGGIIYFAQNLNSRSQITAMINNTQNFSKAACGTGVFTAIDEEGGTVARAAQKLGTTSFSNMAYYGQYNDSGTAYNIGNTIGTDLRALGFNVDFAPVADVNIDPNNELGDRIFSSDPEVVANMVTNVSMGMQDAGVSATLKHFPGLGAENGNTHTNSFVVIDRSKDELRNTEFIPFKRAIDSGTDFVMVGHQIVTGFGDDLPCDLSYTAVTEMLRGELGFNGIAVTDAQQMNTICTVYGSGEAAVMSVKAGIDLILMPADLPAAVDAVCRAVRNGDIPESRINESVMRILEKKKEMGLF